MSSSNHFHKRMSKFEKTISINPHILTLGLKMLWLGRTDNRGYGRDFRQSVSWKWYVTAYGNGMLPLMEMVTIRGYLIG
jgi:hypothetical protein